MAILTRLINCCWSLFQWGLFLSVAAALVVGGYLYYRLDDEIRRQVEQRLAGHYRHLAVHVGGARFDSQRGIAIFDFAVLERQQANADQPLVSVDELFLAGQMRMDDLISGRPPIERIVVRRPRLRAVLQANGHWNLATLLPLPKFSQDTPVLAIEDATLVLVDAARPTAEPLIIRGIHLTLAPQSAIRSASIANRRFRVDGAITGMPAKELKISGELGTADGNLDLTIEAHDLEISSDIVAAVPGLRADPLARSEMSGRADVTWRISRPAGAGAGFHWNAEAKIDRGRLDHPALSQPLTDVALQLVADPRRLKITQLTGKWGAAQVTLACDRSGWSPAAPMALAARVVDLPLDARSERVLPARLIAAWQRFRPTGTVDARIRATFDGQRWRPHLDATCRGVSLTDAVKFPYPLEQVTGDVAYAPATPGASDQLRLNLSGVGGGRPVKIEADLSQLISDSARDPTRDGRSANHSPPTAKRHPVGWVEISGTDIPLHEQLLAAMKEKDQRLVRSLRAHGAFDFRWRAEWADAWQPLADVTQQIVLKGCSMDYEKFPYPLHDVHGQITCRNREWTFHDVEGRGATDSTIVVCGGQSRPLDNDRCHLELVIQAQNVPLDDNLREALSAPAKRAWMQLRPQGRVDLAARVVHQTGDTTPAIAVTVRPRERSLSIEPQAPQASPYRFEHIDGEATFQGGQVALRNIVARHDRATYSARAGTWCPLAGGGWQLELTGWSADDLAPHRDLLIALPPRLQKTLERLQLNGRFGIHNSRLQLTRVPAQDRIAAAWDLNLVCHQASLLCGIPLENIEGEIRLAGLDDGSTSYTAAELELDSLVWKDIQLTAVRGPLWLDRSLCLLGQPASQRLGQPLRRLTADAYGGSLTGDVRIEHDGIPRYQLELALGGAELARFAGERLGDPKELSGTVAGRLNLAGAGRSTHALSGTGELHIVDANIYELPILVALLKVLRNRSPNTTAFDRCDMQFDVQGEHIHFRQLNLLGDAVSLYGRGETNFDRQLNLVFYSLVGPVDLPIPLWKPLAGQVSQQALQLKVTGTWEQPQTQKDVLPSVNQVLQEIQTGIQAGTATMTPSSAARSEALPPRR